MNYKKGFKIKPKEITALGEVLFTDGTNDNLRANQKTCEAYGYRYDSEKGLCYSGRQGSKVARVFRNITNNTTGGTTESGTANTTLLGTANKTKGQNNNGFVTGEEHELGNGLDNASIVGGKKAKALRQGEVVVGGGGGYTSTQGAVQTSSVQVSGTTTDATATNLTTQDDGTNIIEMQGGSVTIFECYLTGLVVVGSGSVNAGNHKSIKITGSVVTTGALALTITQSQTTISSTVAGISATLVQSNNQLAVQVTGLAGVTIYWTCTVNMHENVISGKYF